MDSLYMKSYSHSNFSDNVFLRVSERSFLQIIMFLFLTTIFYRFMRIFILTQEIHSIQTITLEQLSILFNLLTIVIISVFLLYFRALNNYIYFGLVGIILLALIQFYSTQSSTYDPIASFLEMVTVIGTIIVTEKFLFNLKNNESIDFTKPKRIFIVYSFAILSTLILDYFISFNDIAILINLMILGCIIYLGLNVDYYLIKRLPSKIVAYVLIGIGCFLGIGFTFAFGIRDIRKLIARSIFSESTSVQLVSAYELSLDTINISDFIDLIIIFIMAILYLTTIALLVGSYIYKSIPRNTVYLLVIICLIGPETVAPFLLFTRLWIILWFIIIILFEEKDIYLASDTFE